MEIVLFMGGHENSDVWLFYGKCLIAVGRQTEARDAFTKAFHKRGM